MKTLHIKLLLLSLLLLAGSAGAKEYRVTFPNGEIAVTVDVHSGTLSYDVSYKGRPVRFDVKTEPAYTGQTDKTGTYLFAGNPFAPSDDGWGALAPLFLVEVTAHDGRKGYAWLPMYEVNFAGYEDKGDYVMDITL